jgi:hypothetical protein
MINAAVEAFPNSQYWELFDLVSFVIQCSVGGRREHFLSALLR